MHSLLPQCNIAQVRFVVFCRWLPDELGIVSFARLTELTPLPVAAYDGCYDIWTIDAALSDGCSGPALPEEIML